MAGNVPALEVEHVAAIAEWAADADQDTLTELGVAGAVPSESTFRRTLQRLDADTFDELVGQWAARHTAPGPGRRRAIAVDGLENCTSAWIH